jgi:hypothetical protein
MDTERESNVLVSKRLMKEEVFACWFATALFVALIGTSFGQRDAVSKKNRATLDVISLGLSIIIIQWACFSFVGWINSFLHKFFLTFFILLVVGFFVYLVILSIGFRI